MAYLNAGSSYLGDSWLARLIHCTDSGRAYSGRCAGLGTILSGSESIGEQTLAGTAGDDWAGYQRCLLDLQHTYGSEHQYAHPALSGVLPVRSAKPNGFDAWKTGTSGGGAGVRQFL